MDYLGYTEIQIDTSYIASQRVDKFLCNFLFSNMAQQRYNVFFIV